MSGHCHSRKIPPLPVANHSSTVAQLLSRAMLRLVTFPREATRRRGQQGLLFVRGVGGEDGPQEAERGQQGLLFVSASFRPRTWPGEIQHRMTGLAISCLPIVESRVAFTGVLCCPP